MQFGALGCALRGADRQRAGSYIRSLLLALLPREQKVLWAGILIPKIGVIDYALKIVGEQVARSYLVSLLSVCPLRKAAGIVCWNMGSEGWYEF